MVVGRLRGSPTAHVDIEVPSSTVDATKFKPPCLPIALIVTHGHVEEGGGRVGF